MKYCGKTKEIIVGAIMKFNAHLSAARDAAEAEATISRVGADRAGIEAMVPKIRCLCIKLDRVPAPAAMLIKREMLALGGEAAISGKAYQGEAGKSDVIIMGTIEQSLALAHKLKDIGRDMGLSQLARDLPLLLAAVEKNRFEVRTPAGKLALGERPVLMGVINCTPDSFYDGGRHNDLEAAVAKGLELAAAGAGILDVGGESTRPGAEAVPEGEELKRVIPVIERLAKSGGVLISVDTQKARVAKKAVAAGASIINDISGLDDPEMAETVAETGAAVVLMHMKGTPETMQQGPVYDDLFGEIIGFLRERVERAVEAGVSEDRIIIDPGIGFGKTVDHNLEIIRDLWRLKSLGRPILLGPSNKAFIGTVLGMEPHDRARGTAAALVAGVLSGAHILRVHDVAGMKGYVDMAWAINKGSCEF